MTSSLTSEQMLRMLKAVDDQNKILAQQIETLVRQIETLDARCKEFSVHYDYALGLAWDYYRKTLQLLGDSERSSPVNEQSNGSPRSSSGSISSEFSDELGGEWKGMTGDAKSSDDVIEAAMMMMRFAMLDVASEEKTVDTTPEWRRGEPIVVPRSISEPSPLMPTLPKKPTVTLPKPSPDPRQVSLEPKPEVSPKPKTWRQNKKCCQGQGQGQDVLIYTAPSKRGKGV